MNSELCVNCEVVNISLSHLAFTHALTVPGLFLTHFWTYTIPSQWPRLAATWHGPREGPTPAASWAVPSGCGATPSRWARAAPDKGIGRRECAGLGSRLGLLGSGSGRRAGWAEATSGRTLLLPLHEMAKVPAGCSHGSPSTCTCRGSSNSSLTSAACASRLKQPGPRRRWSALLSER